MYTETDIHWLERALSCATQAVGVSEPNPRVGCVLTDAQGRFLAEGTTQVAGGPHAEVMAMRAAQAAGLSLSGATAYVTLEPCSHHGRTPPCADALVAAGVARVVVLMSDPNPLVAGAGVARLRAAGAAVELLPSDHPLAEAALALNIGFVSRMVRQRPWVRLKAAISLDGRTALDTGDSKWITGPAARQDGHAWRRRASAILTGIGTVLADDPRLDVRGIDTVKQPVKVVLDSQWRLPLHAALLKGEAATWVYGLAGAQGEALARREALRAQGVQLSELARSVTGDAGAGGRDLGALMSDLARRGINELHVEAGARLNAALLQGNWVDELLVYVAPKLIGPGRPMADLPPLHEVGAALAWRTQAVRQLGDDLCLVLRHPRATPLHT